MNRLGFLLILLALALPGVANAAIYTWVGPHGVRHYSDVPHPGAVRLNLGAGLSTYSVKTAALPVGRGSPAHTPVPSFAPHFSILSPTPGQSLFNIGGVMTVSVAVNPPLAPGEHLVYLLDGRPRGRPTRLTEHVLHHVYRGAHELTVELLSPANQVLASRSVRFFVHQHSILAKPPLLGPPLIKPQGPIKAIPH